MHTKDSSFLAAASFRIAAFAAAGPLRARLLPQVDVLERRLALSTYTWSAGGDGMTWNDPNNWRHFDPAQKAQVPGTPTAYSNVVFPPQAILPKGFSKTINFNFTFLYMPLNSLTINDSYTFTGTPITIEQSLSLNNPFTSARNGAVTDIELAGMKLAPGATIYTQTGSMLQLGTTASPTGFLLGLQGAMTKTGGGQLLVDTSSISFPTTPTQLPVPVSIAGGSITLGASVQLNAVNFDVSPNASLIIADNVVAGVRSLTGTGLVNLAGTTAAGDTTSLTILVPNSNTDVFGGLIAGTGQFIMGGFGNLTTGSINFQGAGGITAASGSLQVNGTISAGSLLVNSTATFGGLGTWSFSGPVVFQSGSTFLVTLNGTDAGKPVHPARRHECDERSRPRLQHPGGLDRLQLRGIRPVHRDPGARGAERVRQRDRRPGGPGRCSLRRQHRANRGEARPASVAHLHAACPARATPASRDSR